MHLVMQVKFKARPNRDLRVGGVGGGGENGVDWCEPTHLIK